MKNIIRSEEFGMFALAIFLNYQLSYPWWLFWALFLSPDVSMIGYALNPRVGAFTYNIFHHKGLAVATYIIGVALHIEAIQFAGILLFGHAAFDRMLGYGLKYSDSFSNTHLGMIGRAK